MKTDYKTLKILISKNEYFYKKGFINKNEYIENCLLFANKIEVILNEEDKLTLKNFITDKYSLPKFKLSILTLKAISN